MENPPPIEKPQPKPRSRPRKAEGKSLGLNLPEKLFILSIDDDRGVAAVAVKTTLRHALAGAILIELVLAGKIALHEGRLEVQDANGVGDSLLDEFLLAAAGDPKPRKISHWMNVLVEKQIISGLAEKLEARNILRVERKHYSWVTRLDAHPEANASAKYWVKLHLRGLILADEPATAPDAALLSLIKTCRRLRLLFTRDERKFAAKKVDNLLNSGVLSPEQERQIKDIEAAMTAATTSAASG